MSRLLAALLRRDDEGASAVEYALLAAAIAAVIVAVVFVLGNYVSDMFDHTSECLSTSGTGAGC
jgi:pilus assembly protein Flp/PilA